MDVRRLRVLMTVVVAVTICRTIGSAELPEGSPELVIRSARAAVAELRVARSTPRRVATGTGFFVSRDGKLVTNWHVVRDATAITARTSDGRDLSAIVLTEDREHDLVVLQIAGADFHSLQLADSDATIPGLPVMLIGGGDFPPRAGRTGALRELFGQPMLQVSTPLQPGYSGSPLIDAQGRVVAVANGQFVGATPEQDENFAVPLVSIRHLLAQQPMIAASRP